jgi:hypothetical protein
VRDDSGVSGGKRMALVGIMCAPVAGQCCADADANCQTVPKRKQALSEEPQRGLLHRKTTQDRRAAAPVVAVGQVRHDHGPEVDTDAEEAAGEEETAHA